MHRHKEWDVGAHDYRRMCCRDDHPYADGTANCNEHQLTVLVDFGSDVLRSQQFLNTFQKFHGNSSNALVRSEQVCLSFRRRKHSERGALTAKEDLWQSGVAA